MHLARSGISCNRLRARVQVLYFLRFSSKSSEPQGKDDEHELLRSRPRSSKSLFGIAPRKTEGLEEEESVSESPYLVQQDSAPEPIEQDNYFSKAWAAQKKPFIQGKFNIQLQDLDTTEDPTVPFTPNQYHRLWLQSAEENLPSQDRFTVVSYNVLGVKYTGQYRTTLYKHVTPANLDWRVRKRKIMFEIQLCSPDIICLQVLDMFKDMQKDLASKGYVGLFKMRTGAAPDGCAVFWKKNRFKLLDYDGMEFRDYEMHDNVAQFCVFELVSEHTISGNNYLPSDDEQNRDNKQQSQNNVLIIGNLNALFNPKRGDVKLGQCRLFLDQLDKLSSSWNGAPCVIAGCLNFTPLSPIYDFFKKSELDVSSLDRSYLSGQIPKVVRSVSTLENSPTKSSMDNLPRVNLATRCRLMESADGVKDEQKEPVVSTGGNDSTPPSVDNNERASSLNEDNSLTLNQSILISQAIDMLRNAPELQVSSSNSVDMESHKNTECGVKRNETSEVQSTDKSDSVSTEENKNEAEHCWDPDELKTATGRSDYTVLRHKLKLQSVYPEIAAGKETRDSRGEPLITAYHEDFRGTVDYIWRSDGLKCVKVLETPPLDVLLLTEGLPSKVWGSDHLSLAAELCFAPKQA